MIITIMIRQNNNNDNDNDYYTTKLTDFQKWTNTI